jgi:hypothetical protein
MAGMATSEKHSQLPAGIAPLGRLAVTRRQAMVGASRVGVAVAAVLGGVVGFSPSAEAAVNCIPGTKQGVTPGKCVLSGAGLCDPDVSTCPKADFGCRCFLYCSPARAVCVCYNGPPGHYHIGWGCCVYC